VDGSLFIEADLVIGADGLKSATKLALFPEADEDSFRCRYDGLVEVGGFVRAAEVQKHVEKGSLNVIIGGNGGFGYCFSESAVSAPHQGSLYHVSAPGDRLAWWSTYRTATCPKADTLDKASVNNQLRDRHKAWSDPVIQNILQSLEVDSMFPTWTAPTLPTWERNGVILVGNAAHGPTFGPGVSHALNDVEALARFIGFYQREMHDKHAANEMSQKEVIVKAAREYMALHKPRATANSEEAQKTKATQQDKGVIEEYLMYKFMRIVGYFPSLLTMKLLGSSYNVADEVKSRLEQLVVSEKTTQIEE